MKKLKRKVTSRRDFVRMIALATPAILVAGNASAVVPTADSRGGGLPRRKKAITKKAPTRKKAARKKARRRSR